MTKTGDEHEIQHTEYHMNISTPISNQVTLKSFLLRFIFFLAFYHKFSSIFDI